VRQVPFSGQKEKGTPVSQGRIKMIPTTAEGRETGKEDFPFAFPPPLPYPFPVYPSTDQN